MSVLVVETEKRPTERPGGEGVVKTEAGKRNDICTSQEEPGLPTSSRSRGDLEPSPPLSLQKESNLAACGFRLLAHETVGKEIDVDSSQVSGKCVMAATEN